MSNKILTESMTRVVLCRHWRKQFIVRIWRQEVNGRRQFNNHDLESHVLSKWNDCLQTSWPLPDKDTFISVLAEQIARLHCVNAVEVLDAKTGCGCVVYSSWP